MNPEIDGRQETNSGPAAGSVWATGSIAAPLTGFVLYKIASSMQHGTPDDPVTWTQWQAGRILFCMAALFYLAALPCGLVALRQLPKGHAKRKTAWWGTIVGALALVMIPLFAGKAMLTSSRAPKRPLAQAEAPKSAPNVPEVIPQIDPQMVKTATQIVQTRMATAQAQFSAALDAFESTNVLDLSGIQKRQDFASRQQHLRTFRDAIRTWRDTPGAAQSWFYEELAKLGAPQRFRADGIPDFNRTYAEWGKRQAELCELYDDLALRTHQTLNNLETYWTPGNFKAGTSVPQFNDPGAHERVLKLLAEIDGLREKINLRIRATNQTERASAPLKATAQL